MTSHMSSNNGRIASYDNDFRNELWKQFCDESKYMASRNTTILGKNCLWLTHRASDHTGRFAERYTSMELCQCSGHHCMRIHSLVALFSFLSLLNIDPETTI
jgi:hypothetical protein